MVARRGAFVNPSNTSEELRLAQAGQVVRSAGGTIRTGVLGGPTPWVMVNPRSTMAVGVTAFSAVVSRSAAYGAVVVTNDGETDVTLTAAPSSNSRIDVIWVRQRDTTQGDANSDAELGVTAGTAAGSPTKPSIPAGALELGTVLVPAGVTGTNASGVVITQTHQYTNSAGGVVAIRNAAEQTAFAAANGQIIHRLDTGLFYGRVNTAWVALGEGAQVRQYGLGRTVPNGTTTYYLANTGEATSVRTAVFPNVTYNSSTGAWTLATPGWYQVSANVGIQGANAGSSAQLRFMQASTPVAAASYGGVQTTTVSNTFYSDGSFSFIVDGAHNSGAQRDMTGSLRIVRLGGLG